MKLAIFRSIDGTGFEMIGKETFETHMRDYVRTSEYVEVTFPPMAPNNDAELKKLDVLREEVAKRLAKIDMRKSELASPLSFTHPIDIEETIS